MKNEMMQEAIQDSLRHGNKFFTPDTMDFWGSEVVSGMYSNNTFVTSEDNFNRTKKLYSVRYYDWDKHEVETITFQQHNTLDDAIRFAKEYEE